jgi:hypothetical protein
MTYIEIVLALTVFYFFAAGLGSAAIPVFEAWSKAETEYANARAAAFVADSFRQECGKKYRNIENWKKAVSIVPQLGGYEIQELRDGGRIWAFKLSCVVGGEPVEVLGECAP